MRALFDAKTYLLDREIDINERLTTFFINMGVIAAFFGTIIIVLSHGMWIAAAITGFFAVSAPVIQFGFRSFKKPRLGPFFISLALMFLLPVVWLTSGGSEAGVNIWFIYELFYLALFSKGWRRLLSISVAGILQIGCFVLEWYRPDLVFHYTSPRDTYISVIGSILVVSLTITATVVVQNKIYNHEKTTNDEKAEMSMHFIMSLANIIDAKDSYTGGHSRRVAQCAVDIGREMGLDEAVLTNLYDVASLHDIGKIGVADSILKKPSRLTAEEFEQVKEHTIIGNEMLKKNRIIENACEGALYHHERFDGKGYPFGLAGEDIPLYARIIGVADAYDAMSTDRIYRKKMLTEEIIEEFVRCRGTQFDPKIAEVFIQMLQKGYCLEE